MGFFTLCQIFYFFNFNFFILFLVDHFIVMNSKIKYHIVRVDGFFLNVCVCACTPTTLRCAHTCDCRYPQRPEEGIGSHGARVLDGSKTTYMDAGTQVQCKSSKWP